jgi:hypothetical protein
MKAEEERINAEAERLKNEEARVKAEGGHADYFFVTKE